MANLILTLSCQSLLEIIWDVRGIRVSTKCTVDIKLRCQIPAVVHLQIVAGLQAHFTSVYLKIVT